MVAPQKVPTLEQFLRLPEERPALEYEDGRITRKVSPKLRHARLQSFLVGRINALAEPPKLAMAFSELRLNLGGRSWVPDVAVFRWSRLPIDADGYFVDDVFEPPDLAIEIASPGQSARNMAQRCQRYLPFGTPIVFSVAPNSRTVVFYRPDTIPRTIRGDEPIDLSDVLPGFALTAEGLFASLHLS